MRDLLAALLLLWSGAASAGELKHCYTADQQSHWKSKSVPCVLENAASGTTLSVTNMDNTFIYSDGPGGGFWATISDTDNDLQKAKSQCDAHPSYVEGSHTFGYEPSNPDWWPEPCTKIDHLWESSGAAARFAAIDKQKEARELAFVKRVGGFKQ
jgi:hypothetical protein